MKKNIHVIIYIILFLGSLVVGRFGLFDNKNEKNTDDVTKVSATQKPSDFVIEENTELKISQEDIEHDDDSVSLGTLLDVVFEDEDAENPYDDIHSFRILTQDGENLEMSFYALDIMDVEIEEDAIDEENPEITLYFRSGGETTLQEGKMVKLFQKSDNDVSIDRREHINFEYQVVKASIKSIKFGEMQSIQDDVYVEYMVLESEDEEEIAFEFTHMNIEELASEGDIIVEYIEDRDGVDIFQPKASEDLKLKAQFADGSTAIYQVGDELEVIKNYNGLFWELAQEIKDTKYSAEVKDFIFGHDETNVTSLDYIVFSIPDQDDVKMTFMETQADYAKPVGNYVKIYDHFHGKDQVLINVRADEEWVLKLDYNEDDSLELTYGTKVKIYKDNQDVWRIDRTIEEEAKEE